MPGSVPSMAVQKKQRAIPPSQGPLSTRTIKSQRVGNRFERTRENGSYIKSNSQIKKTACSVNTSPQVCNTVSPRAAAASNGLNIDERLKAARERREEQQKLLASRELGRLEREQRARLYYEQQLQDRKKKLQEQRLKEERRRAAVEEKRKQRLKEEKERHEYAVRRTLEKSQKAQQHLSQNSRGRKPTKNVSYHSMNISTHKPQHQSGSVHHRLSSASPSSNSSQLRSISLPQTKAARQKDTFKKKNSKRGSESRPSAINSCVKLTTGTQSRAASAPAGRSPQRSIKRHSTTLQLELPSVPEEDAATCGPVLSPGNKRPVRRSGKGEQEKLKKENPQEAPCSNLPERPTQRDVLIRTAADGSPCKTPPLSVLRAPEVTSRPSAGTSDPEEASRLLAEKRREARQQREKEERERLQQEEAERRSRQELELRRAEERARQEAEAQRLIQEKKRREEEEQRRAEEERAQAMREAALLQKQREEELAKEMAQAEQMKQEREIVAQKEDAERQARKKRLEEIMRRTRRTDSPDTKSVPARILPNEARPKENTEPANNGTTGDAVKLPVGNKTTQLGLNHEDDVVPVVAFKERRSLRALSGLEEIQTHQRAEVI
ncbi:ensconsin isoform X2 [Leuresthes tenuis]|uniref:ensconsin isoform X2 n=1 Tax=Leuresthes tenuis TaxID=355514 RepID=UPI003B51059D